MTAGIDIVGTQLSIRVTVDHCDVKVWDVKLAIYQFYGVPPERQMLVLLPALSIMAMDSLETLSSYGITDGMMYVEIQLVLGPPPPGPDGYPVPITVSFMSVQPEFANWWEAHVICWEHSTVAELRWLLMERLWWMQPTPGVEIYRGFSDRRVDAEESMGLQIVEFLILDSTTLYVLFIDPPRRELPLAAAAAAAM